MWGNIMVGLLFAAIIALAARKVYKDAKAKKCSCGTSCSAAAAAQCGQKRNGNGNRV